MDKDSRRINYGLFLAGSGTAWIDAAALETVGEDVVSTNISRFKFASRDPGGNNSKANEDLQTLPKSPMNMDFEST